MATVLEIWTTPEAGTAMVSQQSVRAIPGVGLEGDRYRGQGSWSKHGGKPDQELTLIEAEQLEWFEQDQGIPFPSSQTRRNILTRGISLNDFIGKRLRIGNVELEGCGLSEPCASLQERTGLPVLPAMVHRSGLKCAILSEGEIEVGDSIRTG